MLEVLDHNETQETDTPSSETNRRHRRHLTQFLKATGWKRTETQNDAIANSAPLSETWIRKGAGPIKEELEILEFSSNTRNFVKALLRNEMTSEHMHRINDTFYTGKGTPAFYSISLDFDN